MKQTVKRFYNNGNMGNLEVEINQYLEAHPNHRINNIFGFKHNVSEWLIVVFDIEEKGTQKDENM